MNTKTKFNITMFLSIGLVLLSCSENTNLNDSSKINIDTMCSKLNENLLECDFKEAVCEGEVRHFTDKIGDNKPFVDLTKMTMTVGENCVGFTLTVDDMPEKLTLNPNAMNVNDLNYSWGVWIDINANNYPMDGDLSVTIDHYKWEENSEVVSDTKEKRMATVSQMSLTDGGAIAFLSSSFSENTFRFYVPKSLHPKLNEVQITTPVQFSATFNDGQSSYRDYYPE